MSILTAFIVVSLLVPSIQLGASDSPPPHVIYGYVYDAYSTPLKDAEVYVNNTRTGGSQDCIADAYGRYTVGIDANTTHPYQIGDLLSITAVYHNHSQNGIIFVDGSPAQLFNISLNFRAYIIQGNVVKPDGTPARYFNVQVTNEFYHETRNCVTDSQGHYRTDLSTFQNGFGQNDGILASVSQSGFHGQKYTVVQTGPGATLDITLVDIEDPTPLLQETPASVNLSQNFRILVWVTDNHVLGSVRLLIKKSGQSAYSEIPMIKDDGSINDWNGNGMPNTQLYGQSTQLGLPVQTDIRDLLFYINATDTGGNSGTAPALNPSASPFIIKVNDQFSPTLAHTPVTWAEAGVPKEIIATADDNIMVDQVNLFCKGVGMVSFSKIRMMPTGDPLKYNASIPAQYALGTLNYYLVCNDTSNNSVRLPVSGEWSVNVADTRAPVITHTKINSANKDGTVNFTCIVNEVNEDLLDSVWLNYSYGALSGNETMNYSSLTGAWHYEFSPLSTKDIFCYTIWANDTSGNIAHVSNAFPVLDVGTPLITHQPPEFLEFNRTVAIFAYVEDDVEIAGVALAYLPSGALEYNTVGMADADTHSDVRHGNYTANISAQTVLGIGKLRYIMNASDGTNNISWPSLQPYYLIDILDTLPPSISNLAFNATPPGNAGARVRVNVTDWHSVDSVTIHYLNSTSLQWTPVQMNLIDSLTYEGTIPPHSPGMVKFYIASNDSSGNAATLPLTTPKLNPFFINFTDGIPPGIELVVPESMGVNQTVDIIVNATDDFSNASAELFCMGVKDTVFRRIELSMIDDASYKGTLPPQLSSGFVKLYAIASDGLNRNQTSTIEIPVINNPPMIRHTSPNNLSFGVAFSIVAEVTDDLRVENVSLDWKLQGGVSTLKALGRVNSNFYRANLSFDSPVTVLYRIIAFDTENHSIWPDDGYYEIEISDLEMPRIIHEPLQNLTTAEMPIIIATVTDNLKVASVEIWYRNAESEAFASAELMQASGTDDYAVILDRQPEGNFTYYIVASDGVNDARFPIHGSCTVEVTRCGESSWLPVLILTIVIVLMIFAAFLVYLHHRRKPIKEEPVSPDNKVD